MMSITAHMRVDKCTQQYYELASLQTTIHTNGDYSNLSPLGKAEMEKIQERVDAGDITDVITDYYLMPAYSGMWVADQDSPFKTECIACMNTHNNMRAVGWCVINGTRHQKMTSTIIYYTNRWCYTQSGNIYLLVNQIDPYLANKISNWL